ncbi:fibrinogen-like protein 1-like protein [Carcharodon carcharias]|uniref:fibrinogen-like protein 1-like protein n=1 Tax=Carcharodon carcharias TaxID=13397 RepID=UPI001B7F2047|nr:fibrinogen-like protein 1-like protein [Carcharodon carcharias]
MGLNRVCNMFSQRTLIFMLLAVFMVENCSAFTTVFSRRNRIDNINALTMEQKAKILNLADYKKGVLHRDCRALNRLQDKPSGIYVIKPSGSVPFVVYCDMDTEGGGWVVLQRVSKQSNIQFANHWSTYKHTFGDVEDDYWLGNEYIHLITQHVHYEVKFVIVSKSERVEVNYTSFTVEDENNKYKLRLGAPIGGSVSYDILSNASKDECSDNMMFSTSDQDNDRDVTRNCAAEFGGGWWFNKCSSVIFNDKQIRWPGICDDCLNATILIRPSFVNCL